MYVSLALIVSFASVLIGVAGVVIRVVNKFKQDMRSLRDVTIELKNSILLLDKDMRNEISLLQKDKDLCNLRHKQ